MVWGVVLAWCCRCCGGVWSEACEKSSTRRVIFLGLTQNRTRVILSQPRSLFWRQGETCGFGVRKNFNRNALRCAWTLWTCFDGSVVVMVGSSTTILDQEDLHAMSTASHAETFFEHVLTELEPNLTIVVSYITQFKTFPSAASFA
jgi:hypothetical protein